MSIQILSPEAGDTFTTTQSITISGINGPAGTIKVDSVVQLAVELAEDDSSAVETQDDSNAVETHWRKTIPPITTPGTHTISVDGPGVKSQSVVITVTAATV